MTREDEELQAAVAQVASETGLDKAALLAVCQVESGGRTTARIGGRDEPLIRFEGHYFHRLLPAIKRNRAIVAGLANARAGAVRNPRSQARRWALLGRAIEIDRPAALASTSWGVGQVMGAHWRWLGYASIDALVVEVRGSVEGQVRLMARYIVKARLGDRLEARDWAGFARAYNGPGYRRNRYDRKLAAAHAEITGEEMRPQRNAMALMALGSYGSAVEDLQRDLRHLGHPLIADGDFGPATEAAVRAFQKSARLVVDGIAGPKTLIAIDRRLPQKALAG